MSETTKEKYEARVKGPGKFEGEPAYVPYFWDISLDGGANNDEGATQGFHVHDADRLLWPDLGDTQALILRESEQGFIYSETFTTREEYQKAIEAEPDLHWD